MITLVIFLGVFALTSSVNFFTLNKLSTKRGAMCLDGSPAAVYTFQPDSLDKAPNKLLIMFQENLGGWCMEQTLDSTLIQCGKLTQTDYGSSTNYANVFINLNGILAPGGGQFNGWRKVLIKSCDGGTYLGDNEISYKKGKLYFKGSKIVQQAIQFLNSKKWLQTRQVIVLAGTFNGGLAAVHWSEVFQKNTKGVVKVMADSAFFLNQLNEKKKQNVIQQRLKTVSKVTLENITFPHSKCASVHASQLWRCFLLQELISLTNFPVFIIQSLYDNAHIKEILGFECASETKSLSQCSKVDRDIIQSYHLKLKSKVVAAVNSNDKNGVFGISCINHDLFDKPYNLELYEVPMQSNNTVAVSISRWLNEPNKLVLIDKVEWPNNSPCAHKLSPRLSKQ